LPRVESETRDSIGLVLLYNLSRLACILFTIVGTTALAKSCAAPYIPWGFRRCRLPPFGSSFFRSLAAASVPPLRLGLPCSPVVVFSLSTWTD